ncbi:MAG: hypothetical protein JWN98_1939 [Abditibacteriota bacterium]|nr:hypothetical protein [Abditibacteriota bacterium]
MMTVLFSPLGLVYGTLYSAILLVRPQRVVVVTSPQAAVHLHSALDAARFYHSGFEFEAHILNDPLSGFEEARRLARRLAARAEAHNVVNLTGGTTVLQDCVRSIADILRSEPSIENSVTPEQDSMHNGHHVAHLVREVAVVDRRSAADQSRAPLVVGELVEVPPL